MDKKDSAKNLSLRDQYNLSLKNLRRSAEFQSLSTKDQYAMMDDLKERYEQAKAVEEEQKKQISLAQAAQNAEALQALEEQKNQQTQQLAGKRLEQLQSIPSDIRGLEAMRRSNVAYGFGLGGSTPWTYKTTTNPQTGAITRVPTLKQGYTQVGQGASLDSRPIMAKGPTLEPAGKKVGVMGAGTAFKQEYRGIREGLERGGATVIEAPEKFVRGKGTSERDSRGQFYSEVTGRPMGSLMGRGAYGGFGKNAVDEQGNPLSKYSPNVMKSRAARGKNPYGAESTGKIQYSGQVNNNSGVAMAAAQVPSSSMGITGSSPLAFTGFGLKTGFGPNPTSMIEPPANSPFYGRLGYGASYGMFSQFPYAGY
jgi:hypothetical protein